MKHPDAYVEASQARQSVVPLPQALCRLLYTLCKVRGHKVIVRLLNNEPRYIEPMLSCIRRWNISHDQEHPSKLAWEVKYIMYLWMSHLMLAPFELSTLSTSNVFETPEALHQLSEGLPDVARDVLSVAFESLSNPSKERESAVLLLVRLVLRRDMQAVGLPQKLVDASIKALLKSDSLESTVYQALGHLSLLYSITNLASDTEVAPFLSKVYQTAQTLVTSELPHHSLIKDSAPARKLLLKVMKACLTHAINLNGAPGGPSGDMVNRMLEDSIQYYLDVLGDKDSPVRMATSKALSIVALKIDALMSAEIVEAVLGCLSENVLVDDRQTGQLLAKTDMPLNQSSRMKRNLSAVDALRWHGLMLTLGHLLFRRSPPPHQLTDIIEALILGLEFEQRSNVGTSIGIGVRDGACFGIWALARKYSTKELESVNVDDVAGVLSDAQGSSKSILQLIAVRLVLSSCLDPSGNIRRGSSAALQELIGRHPDMIIQGIPVVQVVDYHAVARRSRAVMEVAVQAAALDATYYYALLEALLDWRGARAADANSRRWSSIAMGELCKISTMPQKVVLLERMLSELAELKSRNLGITAGARHGLLLCSKAVIGSVADFVSPGPDVMFSAIQKYELSSLTGSLDGRTTGDLEVVLEGIGSFLATVSEQLYETPRALGAMCAAWVDSALPMINRCLVASEKDNVVEPCTEAMIATFAMMDDTEKIHLIGSWLDHTKQKVSEMYCRGRLTALGVLYTQLAFDVKLQGDVQNFLLNTIKSDQRIEIKTNAMKSLDVLVQHLQYPDAETCNAICGAVIFGLSDYTNDQRGDVGSLLRIQSLEAVGALRNMDSSETSHAVLMDRLLPHVVRLTLEKLAKVRYLASNSLEKCWGSKFDNLPLRGEVLLQADVSSETYFKRLMPLLQIETLRKEIFVGLSSSIGGGTDDVCRACCSALLSSVSELEVESRMELVVQLTSSLLKHLHSLVKKEDHEIVPALHMTAFFVEQGLVAKSLFAGAHNGMSGIWEILQTMHLANASMERLGALIKLYQALLNIPDLRNRSLDKLIRQLLHRYPKVSALL